MSKLIRLYNVNEHIFVCKLHLMRFIIKNYLTDEIVGPCLELLSARHHRESSIAGVLSLSAQEAAVPAQGPSTVSSC